MITKYLFSFSTRPLDKATLFVTVWVGEGKQDQRDLNFFESLANQCKSYFFRRWDQDCADFIAHLNEQFQLMQNDTRARCLLCSMSAAKLRRLIRNGLYDDFAQTFYQATRGLRRMNLCANSAYHCAFNRASQALANPRT